MGRTLRNSCHSDGRCAPDPIAHVTLEVVGGWNAVLGVGNTDGSLAAMIERVQPNVGWHSTGTGLRGNRVGNDQRMEVLLGGYDGLPHDSGSSYVFCWSCEENGFRACNGGPVGLG